ncbi:hypothetical protein D3C78_1753300 [compost metagenome]
MLLAVIGHHGVRGDLADGLVHHRHVRPGQGRVEIVGDQDALAAHRVVRQQAPAQRRIGDPTGQVQAELQLHQLHQRREHRKGQRP